MGRDVETLRGLLGRLHNITSLRYKLLFVNVRDIQSDRFDTGEMSSRRVVKTDENFCTD